MQRLRKGEVELPCRARSAARVVDRPTALTPALAFPHVVGDSVALALLRVLEMRDALTARHSVAVARYSRALAEAAGLPEHDQDLVHTAALVHDIGKTAFPDRILSGREPLAEGDWQAIRLHPYEGALAVSEVPGLGAVSEIVLSHHERIDGQGYPRGLSGEEIPLLARVISVADCFDAITARDSYREPRAADEAVEELLRVAGTQLDADLVSIFVWLLEGTGAAGAAPAGASALRGRVDEADGAPMRRRTRRATRL